MYQFEIFDIGKTFFDYIFSFQSDEGNNEKMFQSSDDDNLQSCK